MDKVINLRLLTHPVNWLVVWTVLLVAGFGYSLIHARLADPIPPTDTQG